MRRAILSVVGALTLLAPVAHANVGWKLVFSEDFNTSVPLGSFPGPSYASRWAVYPSGWPDTSGRGTYSPENIKVSGGFLQMQLQTVNDVHKVAAIVPQVPGNVDARFGIPLPNQTYGRYSVRWRITRPMPGFKLAFLLWPQSENMPRDGEIDFPEMLNLGSPKVSGFVHRRNSPPGFATDQYVARAVGAFFPQWHLSVTEWTPGSVKFFLDGRLVGDMQEDRVPNTPMGWVLQTEVQTFGDAPKPAVAGEVHIDQVKAWVYPQ